MSTPDNDFVFSTLIARHPDPATASRALAAAEAAVLRRAADAIEALPQDYECDPGRGDAVERLRRTADGIGEKTGLPTTGDRRDEFLAGLAKAGGTPDGTFEERSPARARVHAMFTLGPDAERELDARLDGVRDETLAEVVAWLKKKAREFRADGDPRSADVALALAWKAARGAIRADSLRTLPADFFQPGHTYLHKHGWKFRCDALASHPVTGRRVGVGYSIFSPSDCQTSDLGDGAWADGDWTDVTEAGDVS